MEQLREEAKEEEREKFAAQLASLRIREEALRRENAELRASMTEEGGERAQLVQALQLLRSSIASTPRQSSSRLSRCLDS